MVKLKHLLGICLLFTIVTFTACTHTEPVTNDEAKATAAAIEKAVRNQKPDGLLNLFDIALLRENVAKQNSHLSKTDINAAITEGAIRQFAAKVVQSVRAGSYKLLRIYDTGGVRHMVFRLFGDEGINYHDFTLIKINGKVKAGDVFVFLTGENISKTFAVFLASDPSFTADGPPGAAEDFVKLIALKNKKDYSGQIELIDKLTPRLRKTKVVQLINIEAARHMNTESYKDALEEYANLYPNEPNTYMMMLDVFYLTKEYDKGLYAVNKLDSLVKGDPVLNLFRGNVYKGMGDKAKCRECYEKCFAYDPYIKNNMQQLAATYAEANEMDKAKAVIEKYKQNPRFQDEDIAILYQLYPALK